MVIFARAENNPFLRSSCPLHLYIIGSPAILFLAIILHNVCFILHLSLHKWCQENNTCTGKTAKMDSQNTLCVRASGASERFLEFFNSLFATFANLHVRKRATFADVHSYTHAYIVHSYCSMKRLPLFLVRTVCMHY